MRNLGTKASNGKATFEGKTMKMKKTNRHTAGMATKVFSVFLAFVLAFSQGTVGWADLATDAEGADAAAQPADVPAAVSETEGSSVGAAAPSNGGATRNALEQGGEITTYANAVSGEPETVQLDVTITELGNATVSINGEAYTAPSKVSVPEGQDLTFSVAPADGYVLAEDSVQIVDTTASVRKPVSLAPNEDGTYTISAEDMKVGLTLAVHPELPASEGEIAVVAAGAATTEPATDGSVQFKIDFGTNPAPSFSGVDYGVYVKQENNWAQYKLTREDHAWTASIDAIYNGSESSATPIDPSKPCYVEIRRVKVEAGKTFPANPWDSWDATNDSAVIDNDSVAYKYKVTGLNSNVNVSNGSIVLNATLLHTGEGLTEGEILSGLGIATEFGVFTSVYRAQADGHMESNIATDHFVLEPTNTWTSSINATVGTSSRMVNNVEKLSISVEKTLSGGSTNAENRTFYFGLYAVDEDGAITVIDDKLVLEVDKGKTLGKANFKDINVGDYMSSKDAKEGKFSHFEVYELDALGGDPVKSTGTVANNGIDYKVSYSDNELSLPGNEFITAQSNVNYVKKLTGPGTIKTQGSAAIVVPENFDKSKLTWNVGEHKIYEVTSDSFDKPFNSVNNSDGITGMLSSDLAALSEELAKGNDSDGVQYFYVKDTDLCQSAAIVFPYDEGNGPIADSNHRVNELADAVVINVICTGNNVKLWGGGQPSSISIGSYKLMPSSDYARDLSTVASKIIWNYVKDDGTGKLAPFTGTVGAPENEWDAGGSSYDPHGTQLIPKGVYYYGSSTPGSVIAKEVVFNGGHGEMHKVTFGQPTIKNESVACINTTEGGGGGSTEEFTSLTVNKVWDDEDNADKLRPDSVTVTLKKDGQAVQAGEGFENPVTLNEGNGWSYTWSKLPKLADGSTYTVEEQPVEGYTTSYPESADPDTVVIKNTHEVDKSTTSVSVNKVWNDRWSDSDDAGGNRPAEVKVQLQKKVGNDWVDVGESASLNKDNGWAYTWEQLQKNANGSAIEYQVVELDTAALADMGYTSAVSRNDSDDGTFSFTITNTMGARATIQKLVEVGPVQGSLENTSALTDATYKFDFYEVDGKTETYKASATVGVSDGAKMITGLEPGKTYRVVEDSSSIRDAIAAAEAANADDASLAGINHAAKIEITGSASDVTFNDDGSTTFTYNASNPWITITAANTFTAEKKGALEIAKNLVDPAGIAAGKTFTFQVTGEDGKVVGEPQHIGAGETARFENLAEGTYTIEEVFADDEIKPDEVTIGGAEQDAGNKFKATVTVSNGTTVSTSKVVYTNTYTNKLTTVSAKKAWTDSEGQPIEAPAGAQVTVRLFANGEAAQGVEDAVLSADSETPWTATWENLPARDSNGDIAYTVEEVDVTGINNYENAYDAPNVSGPAQTIDGGTAFTITNKEKERSLEIEKAVAGLNDEEVADAAYEFVLQRVNADGSTTDVETFSLAYNSVTNAWGSKALKNLPYGTYKLTEKDASVNGKDWTCTVAGEGLTNIVEAAADSEADKAWTFEYSEANAAAQSLTLTATNTYEDTVEATGALKITKNLVDPAGVAAGKTFSFQVTGPNYNDTVTLSADEVKAGAEKVLPDLAPGTYTITEVFDGDNAPSKPNSVTVEGAALQAGTYSATVEVAAGETDAAPLVEFTNTYEKKTDRTLTIKKEAAPGDGVDGAEIPADKAYSFTLRQVEDESGNPVMNGAEKTFLLTNGATSEIFEDLPYGAYELTEQGGALAGKDWAFSLEHRDAAFGTAGAALVDGRSWTFDYNESTAKQLVLTAKNSYTKHEEEHHGLVIEKDVTGLGDASGETYHFTLQQVGEDGAAVAEVAEFDLADGQTTENAADIASQLKDLPYGTYKLTEEKADVDGKAWTAALAGSDGVAISGPVANDEGGQSWTFDYNENVAKGKAITLTATNDYADESVDERVSLSVEKVWQDEDGSNLEASEVPSEAKVTVKLISSDVASAYHGQTVELSANNNWQDAETWKDLPARNAQGDAVTYSVEEVKVEGADGFTFDSVQTDAQDAYAFTIVNKKQHVEADKKGSLSIAKIVDGDGATEADKAAEYAFSLKRVQEEDATEPAPKPVVATVKGGETATVSDLEPGTYTLEEVFAEGGKVPNDTTVQVTKAGAEPITYEKISDVTIEVAEGDTPETLQIVATNTYKRAEASVSLRAHKFLAAPSVPNDTPFSFMIEGAMLTGDAAAPQFAARGEVEATDSAETIADNGQPFAVTVANTAFTEDNEYGLPVADVVSPKITYSEPGTYYYLMRELPSASNAFGLQYDPMTWAVEVAVTQVEKDNRVTLEAQVNDLWQCYEGEEEWYYAGSGMGEGLDEGVSFWNMGVMLLSACFADGARIPATDEASARETWVDPTVFKQLMGAELEEDQFSFTLYELSGENLATETPKLRVGNDRYGNVSFDNKAKTLDASGNVTSGGIAEATGEGLGFMLSYTEANIGEHWYVIREDVDNRIASITYDEGKAIYVRVNVTLEDDMLKAECAYYDAPSVDANELDQVEDLTFVNEAEGINLQVRKQSKDETKDPLMGSTYGLWIANFDGGRDVYLGSATSDENGYITFENVNLIEGESYYFKEEAAPEGHLVDSFRSAMFSPVWKDGKVSLVYENEDSFVNRGLGGDGKGDATQWKDNMEE